MGGCLAPRLYYLLGNEVSSTLRRALSSNSPATIRLLRVESWSSDVPTHSYQLRFTWIRHNVIRGFLAIRDHVNCTYCSTRDAGQLRHSWLGRQEWAGGAPERLLWHFHAERCMKPAEWIDAGYPSFWRLTLCNAIWQPACCPLPSTKGFVVLLSLLL